MLYELANGIFKNFANAILTELADVNENPFDQIEKCSTQLLVIRSLLFEQNLWLTCIGIGLGLPAGYALITFMLSTMSESMDMVPRISVLTFTISMGGTFLLSAVVGFISSLKLKGIDMVSSLKSV